MAAVCAMLTFASCGNDIELTEAQAPVKGEYKVTFTASQESSVTRTAVYGTDVVWQAGDAITVFDGAGVACPFEIAKGVGTTLGEFQGTITVTEPKSYCAVYPAMEDATIDSDYGISGLSLPVEQVATPNGFDPQAAIMTARNDNADKINSESEDLTLGEFKHVCAFVKVTTTEPYDKITFTAKGGEGIAGGFTVTLGENGISTVTPAADASTTVCLVPAAGSTKIAAGTYLIAVLPGALTGGFTMVCIKDNVENSQMITMTRSFNNAVEETVFARRNVVNMGTVEEAQTHVAWVRSVHAYVDLGLSVKWATCNVGAISPEDYGVYYAWGVTTGQGNYDWAAYKWSSYTWEKWGVAPDKNLTKYNINSNYGIVDNRTVLELADDTAHRNWGGIWRMPSNAEIEELLNTDNCTWEWISQNSVNGYKVTSNKEGYKDKSIFLPAAGSIYDILIDKVGQEATYWSSDLYKNNPSCACVMYFYHNEYTSGMTSTYNSRFYGFSVRPVCP